MQRVEGPQTPYESYCHRCRVTFPVEARRCVHCGGRLGRHAEAHAVDPTAGPGPVSGGPAGDDGEELETGSLMLRRFGGLAVWGLIALSALLSNLCRG